MTDRVCAPATVCYPGEYESRPLGKTTDRECQFCADCGVAVSTPYRACTAISDAVCEAPTTTTTAAVEAKTFTYSFALDLDYATVASTAEQRETIIQSVRDSLDDLEIDHSKMTFAVTEGSVIVTVTSTDEGAVAAVENSVTSGDLQVVVDGQAVPAGSTDSTPAPGGLSTAAIAGIGAGVGVLLILLLILVVVLAKRNKRNAVDDYGRRTNKLANEGRVMEFPNNVYESTDEQTAESPEEAEKRERREAEQRQAAQAEARRKENERLETQEADRLARLARIHSTTKSVRKGTSSDGCSCRAVSL